MVHGLNETGRPEEAALFSSDANVLPFNAESVIDPFVGRSPAIVELARNSRRVLQTDSPILILGETGVGKSYLARWLHAHGLRAKKPFVELNCAGLTREFLETELFGHERGAFTGAVSSKPGLFEIAEGGTVFLDEIGDMEVDIQAKLLKVLEERRYRRMGDVRDRRTDVRLIAATHQDLGRRLEERRFRSDLYFRISTIQLAIPPLRERREDMGALTDVLLRQISGRNNRKFGLAAGAMHALKSHPWPGNLRELRNVLERALLFSEGDLLCLPDLRFDPCSLQRPKAGHLNTDLSLAEVERLHIEQVLQEEGGKVAQAALRLRVPRSTLYQKIKSYRIGTSEG